MGCCGGGGRDIYLAEVARLINKWGALPAGHTYHANSYIILNTFALRGRLQNQLHKVLGLSDK